MEEYASMLIAALAADHGQPGFEYIAESQSLHHKQTGVQVSLMNAHATFILLPTDERAASIQRVAAGIARVRDDDPDLDKVRDLLLPKVWTHGGLSMMATEKYGLGATSKDIAVTIPRWSLGEHMAAFLAINYPDSVKAVMPEDLLRWGVSKEVLCKEAEERLARKRLSWEAMSIEGAEGPFLLLPEFPDDETYFASQLLLVPTDERLGVKDSARAVLPSKDTLLVYVGENADLDQVFLGEIERASKEAYPLSPVPLVLEGGSWKDWTAPVDDPQGHRYRIAFRRFQASLYAGQASVLRELRDSLTAEAAATDRSPTRSGVPRDRIPFEFIAPYELHQKVGEAETFSWTVWGENVDSLLPKVDILALAPAGANEDDAVMVKWSDVEKLAGRRLVPVPGTVPPLFRTRGFPSKRVLSNLAKLQ